MRLRFCHLPYKICKMVFRYAQKPYLTTPLRASLREGPTDAYLALNGGASRSPKRGITPTPQGASPLTTESEKFPFGHNFLSVYPDCIFHKFKMQLGHIPSQKYDKTRFVNSPVLSHFFPLVMRHFVCII